MITIADLRDHDAAILAITMGGIRTYNESGMILAGGKYRFETRRIVE